MTQKVDLYNDWKIEHEFEKAIEKNIEHVPWEGDSINVSGAVRSILQYLQNNHYSLLRHTKNEQKQ